MKTSVYEWTWRRNNGKHFLQLNKDGNKIGSVRKYMRMSQHDYKSEYCKPPYVAYAGGKKLGYFYSMIDGKISVEKYLGILTMKKKSEHQT